MAAAGCRGLHGSLGPGGFTLDLKTGKASSLEQLRTSRTSLFRSLARAEVSNEGKLRSFEDGVVTVEMRYSLSVTSRSGKTFSEVAKESYRVKKFGDRWLIIENRDCEP
ncbi:MAG: hypothetical protein RL653_1856 [Pseudomonadota bacterium]